MRPFTQPTADQLARQAVLQQIAEAAIARNEWEESDESIYDCAHVKDSWYETSSFGDEGALLFWDGVTLWQTNQMEPLSLNELKAVYL